MKPLSEITAMVIDVGGLNHEIAVRLGRDFGKVLYHVPNDEAYTTHNKSIIGEGYDEIELVDSIFCEQFDDVDLFIGTDVGLGPTMEHLRDHDGKKVWSSFYGEELELDRVATKELLAELGMPIGPYVVCDGIDALEKCLRENSDGFVKISWYRGAFESHHWRGWRTDWHWFRKLKYHFGTEGDTQQFIFEHMLADKEELGEDGFNVLGQWPKSILAGIEVKDKSYAGCFKERSKLPEPLTRLTTLLGPVMKELGYCGDFSSEVRIGKDHKPYPIDLTCRRPSPPGESTMEFYRNMPEIMAKGAIEGECVEPDAAGKYVMQIVIKSLGHEERDEQTVLYPESLRKNVKLHCAKRIGPGEYEIVPQNFELEEVGGVSGWGNTLKESRENCRAAAKEVTGTYISIDDSVLDQAEEELEKSAKIGLKIT